MRSVAIGLLGALVLAGCGGASRGAAPVAQTAAGTNDAAIAKDDGAPRNGTWIGAGAETDVVLAGQSDVALGVWVDAPKVKTRVHTPVDVALVVDTSGSMAGAKLENARSAAKLLIEQLSDGDIVSIDTFDDEARPLVAPTVLTKSSRGELRTRIDGLGTGGSTNLYDGLALGEAHVARAPATHSVRRVVVISDGMANVGPSSATALGELAARGTRVQAQVTSLGVGTDYDENTLNALAVRSSGRLYHITDPQEMVSMLRHELELLESTVASDAFVEVVPAPGVQLVSADGVRFDRGEAGSLRIPLGALYAGQHREALVRVRLDGFGEAGGPSSPLASVRLRFKDPSEGELERIQETVARVAITTDGSEVASHQNAKTQSILAVQDAANLEMRAAQDVNKGKFDGADQQLAAAEKKLEAQASVTRDDKERTRLHEQAQVVAAARASTKAAAAAPAPMQRMQALKLNAGGMDAMGY